MGGMASLIYLACRGRATPSHAEPVATESADAESAENGLGGDSVTRDLRERRGPHDGLDGDDVTGNLRKCRGPLRWPRRDDVTRGLQERRGPQRWPRRQQRQLAYSNGHTTTIKPFE